MVFWLVVGVGFGLAEGVRLGCLLFEKWLGGPGLGMIGFSLFG